ncbi:hypothetical protein [Actinoplanes sp. NPDC051851]|uniref:hypothetical protein n=1 Tax=Actinoplanes sp. NPDC051851 TaxID=3154753 RepID=UPI00343B63AB
MILRAALAVLTAGLTAGLTAACATPGTRPATPASVPPGCELPGAHISWAESVRDQRLYRVTRYTGDEDLEGTVVMDQPFTTSVSRIAAPDGWIDELVASLAGTSGIPVRSGTAAMAPGDYSSGSEVSGDPTGTDWLLYESAAIVSAPFTVDCTTPVNGTLTAWTIASLGSVHCGATDEPGTMAHRARSYCPRTPSAHPS